MAGDEGQPKQEPVDEDVDSDGGHHAHRAALGKDVSGPAWQCRTEWLLFPPFRACF